MAFNLKGTLAPNMGRMVVGGDVVPQSTIILNSAVVKVGDAMEWTSGFIESKDTATASVAGILIAVGQTGAQNGVAPDAGTTGTYTVASDNQTVLKKFAVMDISPYTLYSVGADATLGTTTGSDLAGYFLDTPTNDGEQLDESTASATTGNFFSRGVDPDSATRVIVNCNEIAGLGAQ